MIAGALLAAGVGPVGALERTQIYNVYASAPERDPGAAELVQGQVAALEACGNAGTCNQTMRYEGLAPNLLFTLTGQHADIVAARTELAKAKACGIVGYSRRAKFLGGE